MIRKGQARHRVCQRGGRTASPSIPLPHTIRLVVVGLDIKPHLIRSVFRRRARNVGREKRLVLFAFQVQIATTDENGQRRGRRGGSRLNTLAGRHNRERVCDATFHERRVAVERERPPPLGEFGEVPVPNGNGREAGRLHIKGTTFDGERALHGIKRQRITTAKERRKILKRTLDKGADLRFRTHERRVVRRDKNLQFRAGEAQRTRIDQGGPHDAQRAAARDGEDVIRRTLHRRRVERDDLALRNLKGRRAREHQFGRGNDIGRSVEAERPREREDRNIKSLIANLQDDISVLHRHHARTALGANAPQTEGRPRLRKGEFRHAAAPQDERR